MDTKCLQKIDIDQINKKLENVGLLEYNVTLNVFSNDIS